MAEGFLLVDKPAGLTSHDVVARVRSISGIRKVGHAGTLDPSATGLLVVAVGRVTRLIRFVQEFPKEYVATAQFGVATDTLDADGAVLSRNPLPVTEGEVAVVMERFTGTIMQVPPMVSALRVDGRRLYELAREGKEVERDPRPVQVHELELIDFAPSDYPELTFRVRCSKGTTSPPPSAAAPTSPPCGEPPSGGSRWATPIPSRSWRTWHRPSWPRGSRRPPWRSGRCPPSASTPPWRREFATGPRSRAPR